MRRGKDGIYCRYIKRILDLLGALLLCVPSVPILLICYVGIKIETRGPAFFLQERRNLIPLLEGIQRDLDDREDEE